LGKVGLLNKERGKEELKSLFWPELLGSTFMFAAVYLLLYLVYQGATAATASYFGLDPVLRLRGISYSSGHLWYPHAVKRTFLVGLLFMSFIAVMSYVLYAVFRKRVIFLRLLLIWATVISTGMVAQRLIGVLFSDNFAFRKLGDLGMELSVFGAYMYYKPTTYYFLAIMGFLLTMVAGYFLGKPFLQTAWSTEQIGAADTRLRFLRNQLLLPYVLGSSIVVAITFPDNLVPNVLGFASIGLILIFSFVRGMLLGQMLIGRQQNWERWPLVPALVLACVFTACFTVLRTGISL